MVWKLVALAVCLLVAKVQAIEGNPTFGVKLCGREFIRAVIFTCGGSRWRRTVMGPDDPSEDPFFFHTDEVPNNWSLDSVLGLPEAEAFGWSKEADERAVFARPVRTPITEEVLEALRTSRKSRDVVMGLSNACCKWGCSKSEISSLC
ncbi:relaxin 3a precursor-like [Scleropages formosus]|uniref:Relaxin-3 n=1 Tax=Scleropages formosus TaxID=113540 RepID=A0A0P7WL99_SCLFO|nr:relaxin-3-like [Scleropages formosus]KPP64483.1 relaxin 3a precursor-like [Scleropages formosus]